MSTFQDKGLLCLNVSWVECASRRWLAVKREANEHSTAVSGVFAAVRWELASVKGKVAEIEGEVAEVKGDVAEIEGDVAEVKGEVEEVKEEVAEVKEKMAEVKGELAAAVMEKRWVVQNEVNECANVYLPLQLPLPPSFPPCCRLFHPRTPCIVMPRRTAVAMLLLAFLLGAAIVYFGKNPGSQMEREVGAVKWELAQHKGAIKGLKDAMKKMHVELQIARVVAVIRLHGR
ncbi:unnamed protein product [Closterium sp. NIES-65]|nr:unnamed protein product [Closterium sp. NIES-65]